MTFRRRRPPRARTRHPHPERQRTAGGQRGGTRLTRAALYATIAGAVLAAVTVGLSLGSSASSSPRRASPPQLRLVNLVVYNNRNRPRVEVILQNHGQERSIVKEALVRVLHVAQLALCASQGELPLSETYNVLLPSSAKPGQAIATPIHEQLAGDEADRFDLSFAISGESSVNTFKPPERIYVLQLELALRHDTDPKPIPLGDVVLALPTVPSAGEYFETREHKAPAFRAWAASTFGANYYAEHEACWRANTLKLKPVLALPGKRSAELTSANSQLVLLPKAPSKASTHGARSDSPISRSAARLGQARDQ
jgi:hypothetical protein